MKKVEPDLNFAEQVVFLMKKVELDFCFCKGSSIGTGKSTKAVFDSIVFTLVVHLDNIQ